MENATVLSVSECHIIPITRPIVLSEVFESLLLQLSGNFLGIST